MLTFYGVYRSRLTRNMWLVEELGLEHVHVPVIQSYRLVDPLAADAPLNTASASFLAISPAGAIPVMRENGFVLSESFAINMYLARKHGGPFGPADPREDALMLQWSLYAATAIEAAALKAFYVHADKRADTPDGQAELAAHTEALQRPLKVVEQHLAGHGHMVGGRFTVADINMAEVLRYAQAHAPLLAGLSAIRGWLEACQARPAFKTVMQRRAAEPV